MLSGRLLACALLILLTAVAGCKRDLGECNLTGETAEGEPIPGPAAFDIAYRVNDGLPMYEGQALVQSTCGDGSFCHAPAARGGDRIGAPSGMNFDVSLVCTQDLAACEAETTEPTYENRLSRFLGDQNIIRNWAEGMIQEVRAGAMPPGDAGRRVRNPVDWVRADDKYDDGDNSLPSIESSEGQEVLRNWLACGAPAIGRTEPPPSENDQLQDCTSDTDDVICVYSGPSADVEPTWRSVYWGIIFDNCVGCHGPENNNLDENPDRMGEEIPGGLNAGALALLDLTGSDTTDTSAWPDESIGALVGVSASTAGPCAGQGLLVDSGNPDDSIMVEKMYGIQTCGLQMPIGGLLPTALVDVVAQWVEDGAPLD